MVLRGVVLISLKELVRWARVDVVVGGVGVVDVLGEVDCWCAC